MVLYLDLCLAQDHKDVFLIFSKIFTLSGFVFGSMVHFYFIFVNGEVGINAVFFNKDFIYFSKWEGREKERERNINMWLPLTRLPLGTRPTTQA